ncbi:hypothetical protein ACGFY0_14375 [Streptomyces chartreusis]|uniref:hypothetical protein n=1 Tax=Streptomyces chartreusis TaxID=1969 RepID=UPI003712F64F
MAGRLIDDFTVPWQPDASGLWTVAADSAAACLGLDGTGMALTARAGTASQSPYVQRVFGRALDLVDTDELRLWLRVTTTEPHLVLEAGPDSTAAGASWHRRLSVEQPDTWELHRLWLGDMPTALRRAVGLLRLRCPAPAPAFRAAVDDLAAGTPEALRDVGAALLGRLAELVTDVPAYFDVPPERRPPYVLISPLAVLPLPAPGGTVVDNETADGAYVRPRPRQLRLDYRIEAVAASHAERAEITEAITADLARDPRMPVFGEPLTLLPFEPDPLVTGPYRPPATPLYYRLHAPQEIGQRRPYGFAAPFLLTGPPGRTQPEVTPS